ncbi:MAG: GLUG motif-containing protein [Sedimentisphaerales bacterium]
MYRARKSNLFGKITVLFAICCFCLPAQGKYGGGTGEPNDPYLIYDANQMNAIGADANDWDKHFKLMADIDLSSYTGTSFNIIGTSWDNAFTGVFDGNGHTISNFTYISTGKSYIGVFGYVRGDNAEIKDLGLIDPNVDAGTHGRVGSLVGGLREATITNCYAERGSVSGTGWDVGGLVGFNDESTISNCYSTASVSGDDYVGGLVGTNEGGTITNCYASGSVSGDDYVGGLVGFNHGFCSPGGCSGGMISNCYATSSVSGYCGVGGLVGWNGARITNCYSTGSVTGTTDVGGLVGKGSKWVTFSFWDVETSDQTTSAGGTGLTTDQMQTASTFAGWGCGSIWTIDEGKDYPRLWWQNMPGEIISKPYYGGGNGEPNDPYLIYTAEQLNTIGLAPCDWDKHFKLMADIDMGEFTGTEFNIIGTGHFECDLFGWCWFVGTPFTGVFDGNNHTVSNLRTGLFGYVSGESAQIRNLGLRDVDIDTDGVRVGPLVGLLFNGTVIDCYTQGGSVSGVYRVGGLVGRIDDPASICNCYTDVNVSGHAHIGGLVGRNFGTISNCYSKASNIGVYWVGGLTGENLGAITDSYSIGSVSGTEQVVGGLVGGNRGTISNCYSTGSVAGTNMFGGLVGINEDGTVTFSFWDVNTSGLDDSDGGVGKTTAEMQTMSTFTDAGWDFVGETANGTDYIWRLCEDLVSYPRLAWDVPLGDFLCPDGVNFFDFSFFAGHWAEDNCGASNDCDGTDFDLLGTVDINDLGIFVDNWLSGF